MREVITDKGGVLKVMEKGETLNPNGRPRKGISLFLKECEDDGIEPAKKQDIEATYLSLINMDGESLRKVGLNEKQPVMVRKLAEFIAKSKDIDIFEKILDRGIGKAKVTEEINFNGKLQLELTPEEKQQQEELLKLNN